MAHTMINPTDFGDDELVFDEPAAIAAEFRSEIKPARPHRGPRRGHDSVAETALAVPEQGEVPPSTSVSAQPTIAEEPADPPARVPQPDVGSVGFRRREAMLLAIVLLALLTSLLSLGGLIAVGRTLGHAEADRARAEDERAALARVPAVVQSLDDASARLALAASRAPADVGSHPVTADDLRHALDDLRLSLAAHQPDSLGPLSGMTRDGFSELGTRMDRLAGEVEQIKSRVSASRTAPREADRGRPS